MTLASLVLAIIRDICEISGQILQPQISRMTQNIGTDSFQSSFQPLDRSVSPMFRRDTAARRTAFSQPGKFCFCMTDFQTGHRFWYSHQPARASVRFPVTLRDTIE